MADAAAMRDAPAFAECATLPIRRQRMALFEFEGKRPRIHPTAFVAPTATLIGEVTVEQDASVWYGAVLRADFAPIIIRKGANVQDGSVLHAQSEMPVEIGAGATVAHLCVIHSAILGEECVIANAATVLDGARVGSRAMIAAGAVIRAGTQIPDGVLAAGVPAVVKGPVVGTSSELWVQLNAQVYRDLAPRHRTGIAAIG
jgi:carbonic anhydrase/acetyltransferase-like protein (isoleucine patch superfamily)